MASQVSSPEEDQDSYTLGRDYVASARLALVQLLIHAHFGYLLHPMIMDGLAEKIERIEKKEGAEGEGLRIADVGTGTGIFLGELSRELPSSTHLDGFDISSNQYPPQEWYGPHTTLQTLDIFKPLPEELVGRYDVVHLRFFMTVAKDSDIEVVLGNLRRMLKPGGYLQWVERDWLSKFPKTATETDDAHTQITAYLRQYFKETEWIPNLPSHFRSSNLTVLAHQHDSPAPSYRKPWNEDNLMGMEAFSDVIPDEGERKWFRSMHRRCVQEVAKGYWGGLEIVVVVGRREG